ncbi:MAG: CPBP family intramembrane metalloprotease [Lachnospiraceae bacterium]|nr:CPBP family intramembrane metalloprotease [Lachnospiraceae bacterium]
MSKSITDKTKKLLTIIISAIIAVAVMCTVESILQPGYVWKSAVKITMFFGSVVLFYLLYRDEKLKNHFKIKNKKAFAVSSVIALLTIGVIIGACALIQDYVDPAQIKDSLLNKEKVSVDNFLYVALYISAVNSFLEEIFFRGLLFLQVKKLGYRKLAYNLSAFFFAVYHIGIVSGWFNIWVFLLVIFLLYVAGVILNFAAEKCDSFLGSWVIHIAANIGINAIGCFVLGVF